MLSSMGEIAAGPDDGEEEKEEEESQEDPYKLITDREEAILSRGPGYFVKLLEWWSIDERCRSSIDEDFSIVDPFAYVAVLFGSKVGYCIDAVVLGQSLHFHGTRYPYILLITDDVPESWQTVLTKVGWELRRTTYLDGDHLYVAGSKGRFSGVFTKLHLSFA